MAKERNWAQTVASLRAKAADKAVTLEEREALTAKADELAKKHNITEIAQPTQEEFRQYGTRDNPFTFNFRVPYEWSFSDISRQQQRMRYLYFHENGGVTVVDMNFDEDPKQNGNYEFPQEEY